MWGGLIVNVSIKVSRLSSGRFYLVGEPEKLRKRYLVSPKS